MKTAGFKRLFALDFPSHISEPKLTFTNAQKLKCIVEEHAIDIVHTNGSSDNRLATMYASWLSRKKFKVIFTKHNTYKIEGFFSKLCLTRFNDAVILVGPHVAGQAGMGEHRKFFVAEHGIDLNYWKRLNAQEIPEPVIRLVSNSGTSRHKGWRHMVEALHSLPEDKRNRLSVTIVGRSMSWHKEVEGREVINFPGFQRDPRSYLESADVGFVLSYHEASSYAAREMMGMSLPVILSDFSDYEPAYDPACGWLTKAGSADSIKEILLKILDMPPEQLATMKLAARAKAEAEFSIAECIRKTNHVYEWVIQS